MSTQIEDIDLDTNQPILDENMEDIDDMENILDEINNEEGDNYLDESIISEGDNNYQNNNEKKSVIDTCTSLIKPTIIVIIISVLLNNPFIIGLFNNLEFLKDSEGGLNMVVYLILSLIAGGLFVLCNVLSEMFM